MRPSALMTPSRPSLATGRRGALDEGTDSTGCHPTWTSGVHARTGEKASRGPSTCDGSKHRRAFRVTSGGNGRRDRKAARERWRAGWKQVVPSPANDPPSHLGSPGRGGKQVIPVSARAGGWWRPWPLPEVNRNRRWGFSRATAIPFPVLMQHEPVSNGSTALWVGTPNGVPAIARVPVRVPM